MRPLMDERRFFIAPRCAWLIEAFEKCPLGNARYGGKKPYGRFSHGPDAACYPIWRLEDKARAAPAPLTPGSVQAIGKRPRGLRIL